MLALTLQSGAIFGQGDVVVGEVAYVSNQQGYNSFLNASNPKDLDLGAPVRIIIELTGRSKTKLIKGSGDHKTVYRGRANLLRLVVADMQGLPNAPFPFSFVFPSTTMFLDPRSPDSSSATSHMRNMAHVHPLPPSYKFLDRFFTEYKLRLTMWPILGPNGKAMPLREREYDILFQPRFDPQFFPGCDPTVGFGGQYLEVQSMHRVKSLLLLPEYQSRKLTFKEKTMPFFKPSKLPYFDFQVVLQKPTAIHVGQKLTWYIRLQPLPESSSVKDIPTFWLKNIDFRIVASTHLHATRFLSSDTSDTATEKVKGIKIGLGEFKPEMSYMKTITAGVHVAPTFKTFNIERTYSLSIKAEIECLSQTFKINHVSQITVMPAMRGAEVDSPALEEQAFRNISWADGGPVPAAQMQPPALQAASPILSPQTPPVNQASQAAAKASTTAELST